MSNVNLWLVLVLGILIGWLAGWLLELWVFRRRRMSCQRELAQLQAKLRARDAEVSAADSQISTLRGELATRAKQLDVMLYEMASSQDELADARSIDLGTYPVPASTSFAALVSEPAMPESIPAQDSPEGEGRESGDRSAGGEAEPEQPQVSESPEVESHALAGEEVDDGANVDDSTDIDDSPRQDAGISKDAQDDDLTVIQGLQPDHAATLRAAGITSLSDLASANAEDLKRLFDAPEWRQVDYGGWILQARILEDSTESSPDGDDLTVIAGIGPKYASLLQENGITTFSQLANSDEAMLATICEAPEWRQPDYSNWIEQAQKHVGET